jgi:hypothetical protein
MRDQRGGVEYHVRRMQPTPIALGIFATVGLGAAFAIVHSAAAVLFDSIALFNLLMWLYLLGPASSLTVRRETLEIRNPIITYLIPRGHVISVESDGMLNVRVRVAGDRRVPVSALSTSRYRFRTPSPWELRARAGRLGKAVSASAAGADARRALETRYRWGNLLGLGIGLVGLGAGLYLSHHIR